MHRRPFSLADHHLLEFLGGAQVGVRGQVHLDERTLGLADGRQVVVRGERCADLRGADVQGRHAVGLQPDAHGEGAGAQDVGALHALDGGEARLDHAEQVVGDLVLLEELRGEAEVGGGELAVGRLDVEDGDLSLGRQVAPDLVHFGADLGERLGCVVVQAQARSNDRAALLALRLDVFDSVGGGDHALERRGDEAPHQIGGGADVGGGDGDGRVLAARVLAHVQRADGLHARDDDQEIDDDREDRPPDEEIGESHAYAFLLLTGLQAWARLRPWERARCAPPPGLRCAA